jgi:hypothetical protein
MAARQGNPMNHLIAELDRCADAGRRVSFWLRDDDAVAVTAPLERLLGLVGQWDVPVVLAVIPQPAEPGLAVRVAEVPRAKVAPHGFAHRNHAPAGQKKQELGEHRPRATVLDEIAGGFATLVNAFPGRTVPMLVPPWNRIAPDLLPDLPGLGLRYLSTFGTEPPHAPAPGLVQVDCQLDIMDWRTRRAHPCDVLAGSLAALVRRSSPAAPIGILTHHLVHDEVAWTFLADLFQMTARHEAVTWGWPVAEFAD